MAGVATLIQSEPFSTYQLLRTMLPMWKVWLYRPG